jgi:hypothetical protein
MMDGCSWANTRVVVRSLSHSGQVNGAWQGHFVSTDQDEISQVEDFQEGSIMSHQA